MTVIAGDYPGAARLEHAAPNLTVHRMGGRASVFPRAVWAIMRGLGRDADVVLEVINGITFLTPLWLRTPRVALVCHPHRDLYVGEFGRYRGRPWPRCSRSCRCACSTAGPRSSPSRSPRATISSRSTGWTATG